MTVDLENLLAEHTARSKVPGAAVAVTHDTGVLDAHTGVADMTTGAGVTPETRFPIGSIAKPMVATALARLAGADALRFDDPVAAHVPELARSPWARAATIRGLMANRARVPLSRRWEFAFEAEGGDFLSEYAAAISTADPAADAWSYSNTGWALLGRVVETATGLPWHDAMRRIVFDPCGMEHTVGAADAAGPVAAGHDASADGPVRMPDPDPRSLADPGANLLSTVSDLLRFARVHLDDPDLAALRKEHADLAIHGWFDAWCLGWGRFDWSGATAWGWDGLTDGHRAALRIVPEKNAAIAITANGTTGRAVIRGLLTDIAARLLDATVPPLRLEPVRPAPTLARYAGTYAWPDLRYRVDVADRHLVVEREGVAPMVARPVDHRVFALDPPTDDRPSITFDGFDADDRPRMLYAMLWGLPRVSP